MQDDIANQLGDANAARARLKANQKQHDQCIADAGKEWRATTPSTSTLIAWAIGVDLITIGLWWLFGWFVAAIIPFWPSTTSTVSCRRGRFRGRRRHEWLRGRVVSHVEGCRSCAERRGSS
jgi:hypothetical protein